MTEHDQRTLDGDSFPANRITTTRQYMDTFGVDHERALALADTTDDTDHLERLAALGSVDLAEYDHDFELPTDLEHAAAVVEVADPERGLGGGAVTLRRVLDYAALFEHVSIDDVTARQLENLQNPREWMESDQPYPVKDVLADELLLDGVTDTDGTHGMMDEWGDVFPRDRYEYVSASSNPSYGETVWLDDGAKPDDYPAVVHRESMERGSTYVYVNDRGETAHFDVSGDLVREQYWRDPVDYSSDEWEHVIRPALAGELRDSDMVNVSAGWHSALEGSDLSDVINDITDGVAHDRAGWEFPVIVKFGQTRNVCSVGLSVYSLQSDAEAVAEALTADAMPRWAGL